MIKINGKTYLNDEINDCEQLLTKYKRLLKDFTKNYLPMRDKCCKIIREHGLVQYPLADVVRVGYSVSNVFADTKHTQIRFTIYNTGDKKYWWDGKVRHFAGHPLCPTLLEEDIYLDTYELLDNTTETIEGGCEVIRNDTELNLVLRSMNKLEDITVYFEDMIEKYTAKIKNLRKNKTEKKDGEKDGETFIEDELTLRLRFPEKWKAKTKGDIQEILNKYIEDEWRNK